MADRRKYIKDDEFRILGRQPAAVEADDGKKRNYLASILSLILVIGIGIIVILKWPKARSEKPDPGLFEEVPEAIVPEKTSKVSQAPKLLGTETGLPYTEKIDTVINDVLLALYIPHKATPELTLGVPDRNDPGIILAAQAADIRRDNRKILGAFVLKGEPLAWGLSKKGYCAIIDGKVTVGSSENSPLFEEATEKDGYFFRQYPLVDNGVLVENDLKNKTMRKALCFRAGQVFVVVSESDESLHDFSQALVDLGVENAIYLIGSHSAFGWYIDASGEKTLFAPDVHRGTYKNENYIIWKAGE